MARMIPYRLWTFWPWLVAEVWAHPVRRTRRPAPAISLLRMTPERAVLATLRYDTVNWKTIPRAACTFPVPPPRLPFCQQASA